MQSASSYCLLYLLCPKIASSLFVTLGLPPSNSRQNIERITTSIRFWPCLSLQHHLHPKVLRQARSSRESQLSNLAQRAMRLGQTQTARTSKLPTSQACAPSLTARMIGRFKFAGRSAWAHLLLKMSILQAAQEAKIQVSELSRWEADEPSRL